MDDIAQKIIHSTTRKYLAVLKMISEMEKRLGWTELAYLSLNLIIILFAAGSIPFLISHENSRALTLIEPTLILFCLIIGMIICVYWVAFAMRMQIKLKIRYFQARYLERKIDVEGEFFCSDESLFFNPEIRWLESPDKKERIEYPRSGMTRMDGFMGSAKPRQLSLILPSFFLIMYWTIYLWIVFRFFIIN